MSAENWTKQSEINGKIGKIENVIDMLTGLINNGDAVSPAKSRADDKTRERSEDSSPERLKTKVIESMGRKRLDSDRGSIKSEEYVSTHFLLFLLQGFLLHFPGLNIVFTIYYISRHTLFKNYNNFGT